MSRKLPSRADYFKDIVIFTDGIRKKCSKCGIYKNANQDYFRKVAERNFYLDNQCRECKSNYALDLNQKELRFKLSQGADGIRPCNCGRLYVYLTKTKSERERCPKCNWEEKGSGVKCWLKRSAHEIGLEKRELKILNERIGVKNGQTKNS